MHLAGQIARGACQPRRFLKSCRSAVEPWRAARDLSRDLVGKQRVTKGPGTGGHNLAA
jgi:hypothetical protein